MTDEEAVKKLVPSCDEGPHRAVIWIEAEVHELTKHGECAARPKYAVKRFPVYIDGADKFIAIRKLNETLEGLKGQCPAK